MLDVRGQHEHMPRSLTTNETSHHRRADGILAHSTPPTGLQQIPQLVLDALVEKDNVCRHLPAHAITLRRP